MTPLAILTALTALLLNLVSLPSTHANTPAPITDGCECPTDSFNKGHIFDDSVLSMRDFVVYGCCPYGYDVLNGFDNNQIKCIGQSYGQLDPPMKPIRCIGHAFPCPPLLVDGTWKELLGCCTIRDSPQLTIQKKEIEAASGTSMAALSTVQTPTVSRSDKALLGEREVGDTHASGVTCIDAGTYPIAVEIWKGTGTLDGKRVTACCKNGYVLAPYLSAERALQCVSSGDTNDSYLPPFPVDCGKDRVCHGHPRGCCTNVAERDAVGVRKSSQSMTSVKATNLTSYPSIPATPIIPATNHTLHPVFNHTTPNKHHTDGAECPHGYNSTATADFSGTDCLDRQVVYACCPIGCTLSHELSPWRSLMCTCSDSTRPGHRFIPLPHMPTKCLGEAMVCDGYPRACCVAY